MTKDSAGRIVAVDLHASWVGDSDIADLAKLPALTKLDLSETRLTDRGLLDLKTATNLSKPSSELLAVRNVIWVPTRAAALQTVRRRAA